MKILIVSQYFWPENFRINDLTEHFIKKGNQVEVLTGKPNYPIGKLFQNYKKNSEKFRNYKGAKIHRIPMLLRGSGSKIELFFNYFSFLISALFYSYNKLRKKKYDLIITFGTSPLTVHFIAIFISYFTRSKLILWVLDLWPDIVYELNIIKSKFVKKILNVFVNFIYRSTDIILAQSTFYKEEIEKLTSNKVIKLFYSWPENINYKEKKYSKDIKINKKNLNIMFTGNIGEYQNFDEILKGINLNKSLNINWIFIGSGRGLENFKKKVLDQNIDNVIFKPNCPLKKIPEYVNHADVLLVSLKGGKVGLGTIPGKVQTYLKFKKPILCHAGGLINTFIKQNNYGLVSKPGDIKLFSNNVKKLYKLKKDNKLNHTFNKKDFYDFSKKKNFKIIDDSLNSLLRMKEDGTEIKLVKNANKIPYNKNFILSGLNLSFLGSFIARDIDITNNMYHWPDGIFFKKFFSNKELNIKKLSGRNLILSLKVPKQFKSIHVIGNLTKKSKMFLERQFKLPMIFTKLPFGSFNEIIEYLPNKISKNELIILTLPTPKQEQVAIYLSKFHKNYKILCIGGAIGMCSGEETPVPYYLEQYFEGLWRLRFETKRRLTRLIKTLLFYFVGNSFNLFSRIRPKIL